METDYLKNLWQLMDAEGANIILIDIKDQDSKPFKALVLLRGEETITKFKELQKNMEAGK